MTTQREKDLADCPLPEPLDSDSEYVQQRYQHYRSGWADGADFARRSANQQLKQFVQWCVRNSQPESRLLYPNPGINLDYFGVLDQVVGILGVNEADVSAWVDEIVDAQVREKAAANK